MVSEEGLFLTSSVQDLTPCLEFSFWGLKGLGFYSADKKKNQQTDVDNEPSALSAFKPREKLDSDPSISVSFEPIDQL